MLIRSHSHSGQTVFSEDGRALCSRVDPLKEACAWVEHHAQDIAATQVVIVLGFGCGYHLVEIAKRFPTKRVIVIEFNQELVEGVQGLHGLNMGGVEVVCSKNVQDILKNSRLQRCLKKIFYVAEYRSGTATHKEFYEEIKLHLLARERVGFQYQLQWRQELSEILDLKKIFMSERYLLSIKDLADSIRPEHKDTGAARILVCLREFIR